MGRILSGLATGQRSYTSTTGRAIEIPPFHTWVSIESIREDISSAIGQIIPRHVVKYALTVVERMGLVRSSLMLPETAGRYGKLYSVTDTVTKEQATVDPVMEYRIFAYGNTTAFTHGAIASENEIGWQQRQPGDIRKLMDYVAANGSDQSLFRSVGMWNSRLNVRNVKAPVFLPWIVLDIDVPGDMFHAHETTMSILSDMEDAGFDLDRCFASFSGSKGFHIAIPTDHFGSPIFRSSDLARECMIAFVKTFTDHRFDPATLSPLQMLRLTGSKHTKTGRYKHTWTVNRFKGLRLDQILSASEEFAPWTYPDPTVGDVEADLMERFQTVAAQTARNDWERMRQEALRPPGSIQTIGKSLATALEGVRRSQDWGANRSGRDSAAFIIGAYCATDPRQHKLVRTRLGIGDKPFAGDDFKDVSDTLAAWNEKNDPPLTNREIGQKARSAIKYIERRR